mmetsp:Transcript_21534/g.50166  ORF Transcript_21534/g.50166 Transcript_21534/m.50166 type:complete len:334 (-) Transcript_21534:588-1589(-)
MIRPPRGLCLFMSLKASWAQRKLPVRLVPTQRCQAEKASSSTGVGDAHTPALLKSTSQRSKWCSTSRKSRRTSAGRVTSQDTVSTSNCSEMAPRASDAVSSNASFRRPTMARRRKPARARATAEARPMPAPAPVTTATLCNGAAARSRFVDGASDVQPPQGASTTLSLPKSSRYSRTMVSTSGTLARPKFSARSWPISFMAMLLTTLERNGSMASVIRPSLGCCSAGTTRRSASTSACNVIEMDGKDTARSTSPSLGLPSPASCSARRFATSARVELTACGKCLSTGNATSMPLSGSRTTPLKQLVVAALGLPGRTMTVGSRADRPSRKPLRV